MNTHIRLLLAAAALALFARNLPAQLPADAVELGKVKISEKLKSADLCPIHGIPSDASLPAWEHAGASYRGCKPECQAEFMKDPDKSAEAAKKERFVQNFIKSMSTIFCPVTDEVTPGGMLQWNKDGILWESCCAFCDENVSDEDFPKALELLKARAAKSYELSGGRYTEGASSPVEGAIREEGAPADEHGHDDKPAAPAEPAWLKGAELKPAYTEGVGLVMENRCLSCHQPGGSAPMSFMTYPEIRKWTKGMKNSVTSGEMPPWPADSAAGEPLGNSAALTPREVELFVKWAEAGYPEGSGAYKPPAAPREWSIGEPSTVFKLPAQTLPATEGEVAVEVEIETGLTEDRWVVAAEFKPGNPNLAVQIDAGVLGVFLPGNNANAQPAGYGRKLKAGEKLKIRAHYLKGKGVELKDPGASIAVVFAADPAAIKREALADPAENRELVLAPGAEKTEATATFKLPADGEILSVTPVLQRRGKSVEYALIAPGGERRVLLRIPRWMPDYKFRYEFAAPVAAPAGSVVEIKAVYDNSKTNFANPDATTEVKAGPGGELLQGWVGYALK